MARAKARPMGAPTHDGPRLPRTISRGRQVVARASRILSNIHPSHKGTYSVQRLQALLIYCNEVSLVRVILILVVLPIPSFLVTVLLECIPLRDPKEGWKANTGAWARLWVVVIVISIRLIVQTSEMVPLSKLTKATTLLVSVVASTVYVFIQCCVTSAWVYPIPFGYILGAPVYSSMLASTFVLAIGRNAFRQNRTLGHQLQQQLYVIVIQTSLCCIYPAVSAIFYIGPFV